MKLRKKILLILTAFFLALTLVLTPIARAQTYDEFNELTIDNIIEIVRQLSCRFTQVAVPIMVIIILWYGWQSLVATNPEGLSDTKKKMGWAFVGVLVIVGVYILIATVAVAVGHSEGNLNTIMSIIRTTCSTN